MLIQFGNGQNRQVRMPFFLVCDMSGKVETRLRHAKIYLLLNCEGHSWLLWYDGHFSRRNPRNSCNLQFLGSFFADTGCGV